MGTIIPNDATHWDSGDWIDWHRTVSGVDDRPCAAAAHEDNMARLTALHVNLLRAAHAYYKLTGHHLPVYRQIAHVHAALYCDLPLEGPDRTCENTGVEILHLPPHGSDNMVEVDLSAPFKTLIVIRITDNFTTKSRMIQRSALPEASKGMHKLRWQAIPFELQ